jgi:hypothetical protein
MWKRNRVAFLIDDVFQAISLDKAEMYTEMLLNIVEHTPELYERLRIPTPCGEVGVFRGAN